SSFFTVLLAFSFWRFFHIFAKVRCTLVFEMLKILTEKRSATIFVQELERAIQERFHVIPLQQQEVQRVINAWFNSQSFIT
ncbi:hypothetical protein, partial [Microcoleus sp. MON2_D5]|uniref:hypothetical protein n=1 Tax=Microcoleus sp. MON2_D5 TaxID=2818833 RepID=UPI002FCE9412